MTGRPTGRRAADLVAEGAQNVAVSVSAREDTHDMSVMSFDALEIDPAAREHLLTVRRLGYTFL